MAIQGQCQGVLLIFSYFRVFLHFFGNNLNKSCTFASCILYTILFCILHLKYFIQNYVRDLFCYQFYINIFFKEYSMFCKTYYSVESMVMPNFIVFYADNFDKNCRIPIFPKKDFRARFFTTFEKKFTFQVSFYKIRKKNMKKKNSLKERCIQQTNIGECLHSQTLKL